jgi:hypothetical protein
MRAVEEPQRMLMAEGQQQRQVILSSLREWPEDWRDPVRQREQSLEPV